VSAFGHRVGAFVTWNDPKTLGFDPASVFDGVADDYEATRPGYPDALYDAIARLVGPLGGRRILDVGAGTGIASRAMAARGAVVVAVDPSLAMASTLRARSGPLPAALGHAERLPVRTGSVDLVTFAQAWHWVRLPEGAAECRRALRADGRLVLWWNVSEDPGPFYDALALECGIGRYGGAWRQDDITSLVELGGFSEVVNDAVRWEWRVPIGHWLQTVQTRSVLAKLGPAAADQIVRIEEVARGFFPDGTVSEWFTTRLTVATP
jgi:SAM-dependent methyltransferase